MKTKNTKSLCLADLRHTFVAEKRGANHVMVLIAKLLNAELNLIGVNLEWINILDVEANPDGEFGHYRIRLTSTETPATSDPSQ